MMPATLADLVIDPEKLMKIRCEIADDYRGERANGASPIAATDSLVHLHGWMVAEDWRTQHVVKASTAARYLIAREWRTAAYKLTARLAIHEAQAHQRYADAMLAQLALAAVEVSG